MSFVTVKTSRYLLSAGALMAFTMPQFSQVWAEEKPAPMPSQAVGSAQVSNPNELRICATDQLPFSAKDKSGFENKIAELVAKEMKRDPVFVFSDKPAIYLVRDWLDKKRCDVIVGVDSDDQRVLTTKPYYKAGYVFVTKKDRNFTFQSWNDPEIKKLGHIVVDFGSPSEVMLKELNLYNDNMAYLYSLVGFKAPRNQYVQIPPQKMISEVRSGDADLAVAFAPDIARYVKGDPSLQMVPVQDDAKRENGAKLPQQYDQSMAVRLGDTALQAALDEALKRLQPQILAILQNEGIPAPSKTN